MGLPQPQPQLEEGNVVWLRPPTRMRRRNAVHESWCACSRCRAAPDPLDGNAIAVRILIGLPIGLALAKIIDVYVGGPGLLAMFGAGA